MQFLKDLGRCIKDEWNRRTMIWWFVIIFAITALLSTCLVYNPRYSLEALTCTVFGCKHDQSEERVTMHECQKAQKTVKKCEEKKCQVDPNYQDNKGDENYPLNSFYYWLTGLGTLWLVVVAYIKIGEINRDNEAHFFLQLDERWISEELERAKIVLREFELEKPQPNESESDRIHNISEKIMEVFNNQGKEKEAVSLINFLDFMETVGFLYKHGYVKYCYVDALCGESIAFYYKVFEGYIVEFRKRRDTGHRNKSLSVEPYCCFERLAKEVERREGRCISDCERGCDDA
ncbi:MAG: hypothetical protein JSS50_04145 [Proteobacteria bacterium]|nr:hypothetical protein [Pseudomonadota bacterium]